MLCCILTNTGSSLSFSWLANLFRRRSKHHERTKDHLTNTFKHCLEGLSKETRDYYRKFVLFPEDVNITCKVLEVVLDKNKYEVEDIITELRNKSLLVSEYNQDLYCYVYGIHDLLLAHLKVLVSKEELKLMHRQLITNYLYVSDGSYAKLPNDNYIYTYIGHHLREADMTTEFPNLYLNLEFLAAKARAAGCADLIGDLTRYEKYITDGHKPELLHRLEACRAFVMEHGALLCEWGRLDPVQCGLLNDGEIRRLSSEIANGCTEFLYITDIARPGVTSGDLPHALELDEDVRAACFAHRAHLVLVGDGDGRVRLWEHSYGSAVRIYGDRGTPVTRVEVAPDQTCFLALTTDGVVNVWPLEDAVHSGSSDECVGPSPRVRQQAWKDLFDGSVDIPTSVAKTFKPATNDRIISAAFSRCSDQFLVTGSQAGVVTVWDITNQKQKCEIHVQDAKPVSACTLTHNDRLIVFSVDNLIYVHDVHDGEFLAHLVDEPGVHQLLVVSGRRERVASVSSCSLTLWLWKLRGRDGNGLALEKPEKDILDQVENEKYTCAAVTWDGAYLVAGTSNGSLYMWHLDTRRRVRDLSTTGGGPLACLDTFLAEESNSNVVYVLLSGGADRRVRRWHVAPPTGEQDQNVSAEGCRLLPRFSASWRGEVPLVATATGDGRVRVYNGGSLVAEQSCGASCVAMSPDGREVAVATSNGRIIALDYRTKQQRPIMKLDASVLFLEYLNGDFNGPLLIAADTNGGIMVNNGGRPVKLRKEGSSLITCAYLHYEIESYLLTVEKDGAVKSWNAERGVLNDVLIAAAGSSPVAVACFSIGVERLAVARSDGRLRFYDLQKKPLACLFSHDVRLSSEPTSCRFSADGRLLAVGHANGEILVWDARDQCEMGRLVEHRKTVRWLGWSPPPGGGAPLVLASAGDRALAWWDIGRLADDARPASRRRSAARRSRPEPLDLNPDLPVLMTDPAWSGKRGQQKHPELMALVPVTGDMVVPSPRFTCFVTVDSNGLLHVMNLYRPGERLSPT